jgi:nucleoside-diphosphate-sugar epimerase
MVDAFLLVGEKGGGPYNAAGGSPVSIRDITERIVDIVAPHARVNYGAASWRGDINVLIASVDRLKRLGFTPRVNLDEGLEKLFASMREEAPQAAM